MNNPMLRMSSLTPKRQYFYTVNNMKELFEHVKVDKMLAFLNEI